MRRTILLLTSVAFMATAQPQNVIAQNGFIDSINDLFKGKKKKNKKSTRTANTRVATTQRHLNSLGFDVGAADGFTGAKTRRAISAYQLSRGFPETGQLLDHEFATLKTDANGIIASQSADWTRAQSLLAQMGFYIGNVDGEWGPDSQDALDTFRSFTALPMGGPLNETDLATLQEAIIASALPAPDVTQPFDTITLFGNEFALSEPIMGPTQLTWPDVKPHALTALPQSQALLLDSAEAQTLIADKSRELSTAYQTQIDILYVLIKPQIQTFVENNYDAADIASTVADYDIEIAANLIGGNGADMIELWDLTTPEIAAVIALAQSTTHQMQALQVIAENTISITRVGL
jgi:peptidoglycan hydrolase-like protein with peptidoglycan-binding domain